MKGRAITVLLWVDAAGTTDRGDAINAINEGQAISVANDEIAYEVLIALGAEQVNARNRIRWSLGVSADELGSLQSPSRHAPAPPSTNVPVPDGWSSMTSAEKDAFVSAALTRIAIESGLIGDDPGSSERSDV